MMAQPCNQTFTITTFKAQRRVAKVYAGNSLYSNATKHPVRIV